MNIIYRPGGAAEEYAYWGLNHYSGCSHGCSYCYMRDMDKRYGTMDFEHPRTKKNVLKLLEADCKKLAGTNQRVHLCFATDPYQRLDATVKLTRDVIGMLRAYNIPFQVLTKGGKLAERDFHLYTENDLFGVTLTNLNEVWCMFHEPMAAPPAERLAALYRAKEEFGIKTWVSLEPVVDASQAFGIIETTCAYVDLYKIGPLNHRKNPGISWRSFAEDVAELCKARGVRYYLKESLAKYLKPGDYHNTDWRTI